MDDRNSLFNNNLFSKFLISMGGGMMGQPTMGKALTNGMQSGLLSYMGSMDDEEERKQRMAEIKAEQDAKLGLLSAEYGYKSDQDRNQMAAKADSLKMAGAALSDEAEKNGIAFSELFKASLLAGDETAVGMAKSTIENAAKAKNDNSEHDRRWINEHPYGIESPEQKQAREDNSWLNRNGITSSQARDLELSKQKSAQAEWFRQNDYTHTQNLNDKLNEENKTKGVADQSEITALDDANTQLAKLMELQKNTTTGPIVGSDRAIEIRKMLPFVDDITKLQSGYVSQLAKVMENWKGNPTDDERKFMAKATANTSNNEGPNLDLLQEAMTLNETRKKRIENRMKGYAKPMPMQNSGSSTPIRSGYKPFGG
jgi:hypothetical protein